MAFSVLQKQQGNKSLRPHELWTKTDNIFWHSTFLVPSLLLVSLMAALMKSGSGINLLEMVEGPGLATNHAMVEAVQGAYLHKPDLAVGRCNDDTGDL